jgi:hypothetical protein
METGEHVAQMLGEAIGVGAACDGDQDWVGEVGTPIESGERLRRPYRMFTPFRGPVLRTPPMGARPKGDLMTAVGRGVPSGRASASWEREGEAVGPENMA